MVLHPDCCEAPALGPLRVVEHISAGEVVLERCYACKAFWLVTVHERRSVEDEAWRKYQRLTESQGTELLFGGSAWD